MSRILRLDSTWERSHQIPWCMRHVVAVSAVALMLALYSPFLGTAVHAEHLADGALAWSAGENSGVELVPSPYSNPVFPGDAADPTVIRIGEHFYAAATESMYFGQHFRMGILRSTNLVHWDVVGEVFPDRLPTWVDSLAPSLWAPDLVEHHGRYYVYFSAREAPNRHGIGVAWSKSPEGPWTFSDQPLIVGDSFRHIDPMIFRDDDGTRYMYWGSAHGPILAAKLSDDGLSLIGEPRPVLYPAPGLPYQGLIEAPWVAKRGEHYYLFYSGNSPGEYAISVARSTSPLGPFLRNPNNPIVEENQHFRAPGHNAVVQDDAGQDWMVYHAYDRNRYGVGRHLMLDKIVWKDGWPTVNEGQGPSWTQQTAGPLISWSSPNAVETSLEPPLFDVARGKAAYASSIRGPQYDAAYAVDGTSATRWAPKKDDPSPWIVVDLGGKYRVRRTELRFRSTHFTRTTGDPALTHDPFRIEQHYFYRIEYSLDGDTWHIFADHTQPGQIAYPYIDKNDVTARYVRITITDVRSPQPDPGIFDFRIFGHRDFWIETPGWKVPVSNTSPVLVQSLAADIEHVVVEINGDQVYSGDNFPLGPVVEPAYLADGWHDIAVLVKRKGGGSQSAQAWFWVQNTDISSPVSGEILQGDVLVKADVRVASELIQNVRYTMEKVGESSEEEADSLAFTVYEGSSVPDDFVLDTKNLPDGTYELTVLVERTGEGTSTDTRAVRVHNWNILVDPLSGPQGLGWFGTREALKVVDRSEGWVFVSDDPQAFFGDGDRLAVDMRDESEGDLEFSEHGWDCRYLSEYLTWHMPALRRFSVWTYVRIEDGGDALEDVSISVSTDGKRWREVDFEVHDLGASEAGWHRLELRGDIAVRSAEEDIHYFRLAVKTDGHVAKGPQLGEVMLVGKRGATD